MVKNLLSTIAAIMLLFYQLPAFADATDEGSVVADYVEVLLGEGVQSEYMELDSFGLRYMHVNFKQGIWGLNYYEMGTDYSIANTHSLDESNIDAIVLGKGLSGSTIEIPFAGNASYNPVKVSYKSVKYGYWFPTTHTVMVLEVTRRGDANLALANETNFTYSDLVINVEENSSGFVEALTTVNVSGNSYDNSHFAIDKEANTITLYAELFLEAGEYEIGFQTDYYDYTTLAVTLQDKDAPELTAPAMIPPGSPLVLSGEDVNDYFSKLDTLTVALNDEEVTLADEDYNLIGNTLKINADKLASLGNYQVIVKSKGYEAQTIAVEVSNLAQKTVQLLVINNPEVGEAVNVEVIDDANYLDFVSEVRLDDATLVAGQDYSVSEEKTTLTIIADFFTEAKEYTLVVNADGYQEQQLTVEVKSGSQNVSVEGVVKQSYTPWFGTPYDYYEVTLSDSGYLSNIQSVTVGETSYISGSTDSGPNRYQSYAGKLLLRVDTGFSDTEDTKVVITATGYAVLVFTLNKDGEIVPSEEVTLPAPELTIPASDDYFFAQGTNLALAGNDVAAYLNSIETITLLADQPSAQPVELVKTADYYIVSDTLTVRAKNFEQGNYTLTITAQGYETRSYQVEAGNESVELVAPSEIIIDSSIVIDIQNSQGDFLTKLEAIKVDGQPIAKNDYVIAFDYKSVALSAELFGQVKNYEIILQSRGYAEQSVVVAVQDIQPAPEIEQIKEAGFFSTYYKVTFVDGNYLASITSVELSVNGEIIENSATVEDSYLSINYSSDSVINVLVTANGYQDLTFEINRKNIGVTPPTLNRVSLDVMPNAQAPFVGSVSFEGEPADINRYLGAIKSVQVAGTEYEYFSLLNIIGLSPNLIDMPSNILVITNLVARINSEDFSIFDFVAELIQNSGKKNVYYTSPELPSYEELKGLVDATLPVITGNGDVDYLAIATKILALFTKNNVYLQLTTDGFNPALNTTVLITATGYKDLTFTFDGVGNIVSQEVPDTPTQIQSTTVYQRTALPDYLRLEFAGDEYEVADYVGKITNIIVNDEYYKKHSSLLFSKAYMLSKVYGDIFGYYVFVDMTLDGLKLDGTDQIKIVAEGFEDLVFSVPAQQ